MAEDIMIDVQLPVAEALKNLDDLQKKISACQKEINEKMDPAVNNTTTRIQGFGNKVSAAGEKIQSKLGTETALAFTAAGTAALGFSKQCIDSAIASEAAWSRFGSMVNSSGGDWKGQSRDVKEWAKTFSNSVGRSVGDTREAMTTYMQMGFTLKEAQGAMNATAGVAARAGITEAEASTAISQALMGRGKALAKLTGLRVEDYKTADGQIDQERLLNDLYSQNQGAIGDYANTTEAQLNQINNSWAAFKTSIGQALLPVVKIIASVVSQIVQGFTSLPDPAKQVIAVFLLIGGAVGAIIGALGLLAPVIINVGKLIKGIGDLKKAMTLGNALSKWDDFKAKFDPITSKVSNLKQKLSEINLGEKLQPIKNSVMQSWDSLSNKISNVKNKLASGLSSKVEGIKQSVHQSWDTLSNKISTVKQKLASGLNNKVQALKGAIHQSWDTLSNKISNVKQKLASGLNNKVHALKGAVLSGWDTLKAKINSAKATLTSYDIKSKAVSAGSTIKGAVLSGWDMLRGKISGAGNALSGFTLKQVAATAAEKARAVATSLSTIATNAATTAQAALNLVMSMNPIGLLVVAIVGLIAVLGYLYFNNEQVRNAVNMLAEAVRGTLVAAWNALMGVVQPVVRALQILWQTIQPIINDIGALFGALMGGGNVGAAFNKLLVDIPLVFNRLRAIIPMLVGMVVQAVVTQFNLLVARVRMIWGNIANVIRARLTQARGIAGAIANAIRNAIVTRFNLIIARVRGIFGRIVSTIRGRLSNAVSTARQQAVQIYNNIMNKIRELPGQIGQEVGKLGGIIKDKLVQAAQHALSGAAQIVSSFLSGLDRHSPGLIQRETLAEFSSIPGIINDSGVRGALEAGNSARGIVQAWEDNMNTLSTPIEQFDAFNPLNTVTGVNGVTGSVDYNLLSSMGSAPRSSNTVSNTRSSNINNTDNQQHYNITIEHLDASNLEGKGKEIFYSVLDELYPGGV